MRRVLTAVILLAVSQPSLYANTCVAGKTKPVRVKGAVCGRAFDPTGAPAPNVRLRVVDTANGSVADIKTDAKGDFVFAPVPSGSYRIAPEAGWQLTWGDIEVRDQKSAACKHPISVYLGVGGCTGRVTEKQPKSD